MNQDSSLAGAQAQPTLDPGRWKALALLGAAFFMVILDATIVFTAIPSMQEELNFSVAGVQWVITAYVVTFGGLMLFFGRVADLMGRRRVFMAGTLLFVLSSFLCGVAWSGEILIAARVLQGLSAAIMAPTALSLVITNFPDETERNKALGVWGGLGGIGATSGLLLGGAITSTLGWEWNFFINVPVGTAILILCPILLRESKNLALPRSFDIAGAVTVTGALVLIVYAIIKAPDVGWASTQTIGMLVAAAILLGLFVIIESRSVAPLVPLGIFRLPTLVGGNLVILTAGMAVDGMLFPLTLYAQHVLNYSALQFGLASAVMTVTSVIGSFIGQALVTKVGLRPVAVVSMIAMAAGCLLLISVSVGGTFFGDIFLGLFVFGPGLGAAFVASQIAALQGVPEQESGLAAGIVDTSFHIGGALGIAIATSVAVSVTSDVTSAGGAQADPLHALTEGFQSAFLVAAVFAGIGLIASLIFLGRSTTPSDTVAAEPVSAIAQD